ncbi:MAG TPA: TetR family transcriptional regulator [Myxococcota bacterium]
MARPVAADAEATKARILAAAIALVAERGIDGTTVRDVAAWGKVSLATVLHYFGSKEGLHIAVVAAMDKELEALRLELLEVLRPGATAKEALDAMVRRAWQFARAHSVAHKIILRTVLAEGGLPQERIDSLMVPALDDASGILAGVLGVDRLKARLAVQSITQLSARYAIAGEAELLAVTQSSTVDDANAKIADHLVDIAMALLLPSS